MKCPICENEMQEGGLIVGGYSPEWVPLEQFNKNGVKRLTYIGVKVPGKTNVLLRQTKIPNAFYCKKCSKIVGVFDVNNM